MQSNKNTAWVDCLPPLVKIALFRLLMLHVGLTISLWAFQITTYGTVWISLSHSLHYAQMYLLACWLSFGQGAFSGRLALYAVLSLISIAFCMPAYGLTVGNLASVVPIFMIVFALLVSLPFYFDFQNGYRLVDTAAPTLHGKPWRTSMTFFFVYTFVAALMVATNRLLIHLGELQPGGFVTHSSAWVEAFVSIPIWLFYIAGFYLVFKLASWVCLADSHWRSPILQLALFFGLMICIPLNLEIGSPVHLSIATTWIYILGFILASLLFLRLSGVRLSDELLLATISTNTPNV